MQTIQSILSFPDKTPVDSVEGTLAKVYEWRDMPQGKWGPTSVQNAEIHDVVGNKIKLTVWKHKDISVMKGKAIVVSAGSKGGLTVKRGTYEGKPTLELEVGGSCQFHFTDVYHQAKGTAPEAVSSPSEAIRHEVHIEHAPSGQKPVKAIFGATAGLGVNNARQELQELGEPVTEDRLWELASKYARVALRIEGGDLHNPKGDKAPEDVPY